MCDEVVVPIDPTALTAESHKHITRDKRYAKINDNDLAFFRRVLSEDGVIVDQKELIVYNTDQSEKYRGQAPAILKPKSTKEVSEILRYCNQRKIAVVPQGGRTGLVGASVPIFDEIILSLERLNRIRSFDQVSGAFIAESGLVLQEADRWLRERGHIYPLDLALKGQCQIGGNVSTNAGGLRVLKYGSLHGSVLGIEAVLPNGEIFDGLSRLRKDNTGFDLKQMFIGSEGTLGVVTAISVLAPPEPKSVHLAFLGLSSVARVEETFVKTRAALAEILSAFECVDKASFLLAKRTHELAEDPLPHIADEFDPFSVLLETSGSNKEHDFQKLQAFVNKLKAEGLIEHAFIASTEEDVSRTWKWREMVPKVSLYWGGNYAFDVSLPLQSMWKLVDEVKQRVVAHDLISPTDPSKPVVDVIGYGHIGDGNIHLNVLVRKYTPEVHALLDPFVFDFVHAHKGSIAAEHGIGFQKLEALYATKSPVLLNLMRDLKGVYDPNWILNPYKVVKPPSNSIARL